MDSDNSSHPTDHGLNMDHAPASHDNPCTNLHSISNVNDDLSFHTSQSSSVTLSNSFKRTFTLCQLRFKCYENTKTFVGNCRSLKSYTTMGSTTADRHEANPEMYYSGGSIGSPKSGSPVSLADPVLKERSNPSEVAIRSDLKNVSREEPKRSSLALHALSTADRDAHSDNYSLRSSADILDISSKPVSDAALTDISSDATGHAACDIDCDCDHYDCDSWDECEQDSFS